MIEQIEKTLFELRKIKKKLNANKYRINVTGIKSKKQHGKDKELNRYHTYGFPCESLTFGNSEFMYTKGKDRIRSSVWNEKYPDIYQELLNLSLYIIPDNFIIKKNINITLNKNLKCLPHYDNKNTGDSVIIGLGDYTGGRLILHHSENDLEYIDIHNKPFVFNGSNIKHSTEEFEGERYSVIYYNVNI